MKKSSVSIISLIILFSINFVSAQFFSGYNRFSFRGFLDSVDPSTMILITLFSLIFLFLTLILKRLPLFRDSYGYPNRAMIGITSAIISLFTIWWVNRSGLGIENFFYSLGLSSDLLYVILPIILLAVAIFIIIRWGFATAFLSFGLLLIVLTLFTKIFFEKGLVLTIGIVLFLIGLWLWNRRRRREKGLSGGGIRETYGRFREHRDPRNRLDRAQARRQEAIERRLAGEELQRQRQSDRAHGPALREDRRRRSATQRQARVQQQQTEAQQRQQQEQEIQQQARVQQQQAETQQRQQQEQVIQQQEQRQQQELNERQKQREKARKSGLREINKQAKIIDRQLRNPRISDETRKVFEQRIRDLENRRVVFKRYGVGKGNI